MSNIKYCDVCVEQGARATGSTTFNDATPSNKMPPIDKIPQVYLATRMIADAAQGMSNEAAPAAKAESKISR